MMKKTRIELCVLFLALLLILLSSTVYAADITRNRMDGSLPSGWWSYEYTPSTISYITSDSPEGGTMLRYRFPAGICCGSEPGTIGWEGSTYTEMYAQFYWKVASDWDWHDVGQKIFYEYDPTYGSTQRHVALLGTLYGNFDYQVWDNNHPDDIRVISGGAANFNRDQWYKFNVRLKVNSSSGVADGIVQVWVDDVLKINASDVLFFASDATRTGISGFKLAAAYGGADYPSGNESYMYYDDVWLSTTGGGAADTTPNAFSFTDVTGAARSTLTTTSPCVTIAGIDAGQTPSISISGTGCTYNVDGGAYTANTATIGLGGVACMRGTSSSSYGTVLPSCTLTIGGVTDSSAPWTVTTGAAPGATNHYVRAGATGAGNGTDWTNAYTSLPSTYIRGDTYYVASGTYTGNWTIASTESGSTWTYIKKATVAAHGTSTGWNDSYASGQALVNGRLSISHAYIDVDGVTGSNNSGHGIKVYDSSGASAVVTITAGKSHVHLSHMEVLGSGYVDPVDETRYGDGIFQNNYDGSVVSTDLRISYCWIHEVSRNGLTLNNHRGTSWTDAALGLLMENNRIERVGGTQNPGQHSNGIQASYTGTETYHVYRNNFFGDMIGTAWFSYLGGGGSVTNVLIYNNIFAFTDKDVYWMSPGSIYFDDAVDAVATLVGVYNNTFYNLKGPQIRIEGSGNNVSKNNLFIDCYFYPYGHTVTTTQYNAYYNNTWWGTPASEPGQQNETSMPVTDAVANDFSLVTGAKSVNNGVSLSSYFSADIVGTSRPNGSAWDIGAYEYEGVPDTTPNTYSFADNANLLRSTMTYSNTQTITGINASTPVSISGSGCQYRINSGSWVSSSGSVVVNDVVGLRGTSSAAYETVLPSCTLTVGGVVDSLAPWTVTTTFAGPVLTSPVNLATITAPVNFQWQAVSGATKYNLEIDDNSDYSSPVVDIETTNTSYQVSVGILVPARTYYWHVRSYK